MNFTLQDAITKTRRYLNDQTESVWTNTDIIDFIDEGMLRLQAEMPEFFYDYTRVEDKNLPINIPNKYKALPCIYAASRCFEQDEKRYEAVQKRNEFEQLLQDMLTKFVLTKEYQDKVDANPDGDTGIDYVVNEYHINTSLDTIGDL